MYKSTGCYDAIEKENDVIKKFGADEFMRFYILDFYILRFFCKNKIKNTSFYFEYTNEFYFTRTLKIQLLSTKIL